MSNFVLNFFGMKYWIFVVVCLVFDGCMVSEKLEIFDDGSGTIVIDAVRDESSYMALNPNSYQNEEVFSDTIFVFKDLISRNKSIFEKLSAKEQIVYSKYVNVTLREKQNSVEKDFRRVYSLNFKAVGDVPDLFKTYEYLDNINNNYALSAERHDNDVSYFYDGKVFRRTAFVTSDEFHKEKLDDVAKYRKRFEGLNIAMGYTLLYSFPKKIKSVSNKDAIIGADGRSLKVVFGILEASENPAITSFEVIF